MAAPLKLVDHPVRSEIPIYVAALGPKNVALAAEFAEGWIPLFFHPDSASVWGEALADGARKRNAGLAPLEVVAGGPVAICDEDEARRIRDAMRPRVALYVGGMGPPGQNFYNDLFRRYGYESEARPYRGCTSRATRRRPKHSYPRTSSERRLWWATKDGSGRGLRPSGLRV